MRLTAFTRLKSANDFIIATNKNDISKPYMLKIGETPAYKARREFNKDMTKKGELTTKKTIQWITDLHSAQNGQDKTFKGGCEFLLQWYRNTFPMVSWLHWIKHITTIINNYSIKLNIYHILLLRTRLIGNSNKHIHTIQTNLGSAYRIRSDALCASTPLFDTGFRGGFKKQTGFKKRTPNLY